MKNQLKSLSLVLAHNKPVYAVAAIAVCKAVMRPLYALNNKKQPEESRHYTALRDFITELVAIPSYIIMSKVAGYSAKHLAITDGLEKSAKEQKIRNVKDAVGFIAILGAASFVIPSLCNLVLPHAMNSLKKYKEKHRVDKPQVRKPDISFKNNRLNQYNTWKHSSGMRIGS